MLRFGEVETRTILIAAGALCAIVIAAVFLWPQRREPDPGGGAARGLRRRAPRPTARAPPRLPSPSTPSQAASPYHPARADPAGAPRRTRRLVPRGARRPRRQRRIRRPGRGGPRG
ncbi:hypothetical protein NKG05_06035 [Oerskovia sp. M15]